MIHESYYWKEELHRAASYLVGRLTAKRWTDRSYAKLEKTIMVALYSVRKLAEAQKLPRSYLDASVPVSDYGPKLGGRPMRWWTDFDEYYDFEAGTKSSVKLSFIINQIVHSYVFVPAMDERQGLQGIFFNSDRSRERHLYFVNIKKLVDMILTVSESSITSAVYRLRDGQFMLQAAIYEHDR